MIGGLPIHANATPVYRPSTGGVAADVVNAMSVDVEDYFQVSAFEDVVARQAWDTHESRVCRNTERLLALFGDAGVRATFFVLGWVADRFPRLISSIALEGHEVASHGYEHRLVYDLTPRAFREDLRRARIAIEDAAGRPVLGFRAPSYSITARSTWALDVLAEEGYAYDASIFPIHHDRYGIPSAPRHVHRLELGAGALWEVPPATVKLAGVHLPVAGGGYFRLLPYAWTRWGLQRLNRVDRCPAVFYVHPWEIDPEQPRIRTTWARRLRHYTNLSATEARLKTLLSEFRFDAIERVLVVQGVVAEA